MSTLHHRKITISNALRSKQLFEPCFSGASWNRWRAVLKAAFGEPLTDDELTAFLEVAGDRALPTRRVKELVAVVGRGGGKDSTASIIAAFIAMSFDPRAAKLRPGEKVFLICIACDQSQAALAFGMVAALFETIPTLQRLVKRVGADSIELQNKVVIEVKTNSYRSVRGRGVLAVILDECSFFRDDSARYASPDVELLSALKPGLARVPGSMAILISSAYRRVGLLYDRWRTFFGKADDDILVVKGSTIQFNPSFDQNEIDKAILLDPQRYGAEFFSTWRDDLSTFLTREQLEAVIESGVMVRAPTEGVIYRAFADPNGGGPDAFTMSITHRETHNGTERVVTDFVYSSHLPNPDQVVEEIAVILKQYHCHTVVGDAYAKEWVVVAFRKSGITYRKSDLDRSEIYLNFKPLVLAQQVLLIDHPKATAEFVGLVTRSFPGGKIKVDHEPNAHDDLANSIAGACVLAWGDREQAVPMVAPCIAFGAGYGREWDNRQ